MCIFPEEFDPLCQLRLAGGGGQRGEMKLASRVSFGSPPIDLLGGKGLHTAYVACVRVKLAGAAQSIFRSEFVFQWGLQGGSGAYILITRYLFSRVFKRSSASWDSSLGASCMKSVQTPPLSGT